MAKIGLNNFRFGVLTEAADGTPTYGAAQTPGKAISCSVEVTNNDAKLFADDALQESDTSFSGGTVTMGIDREDQETMAALLGHTVDAQGVMVRSANDVAPYVGLGRIVRVMRDNVLKFKVEFINKVKFAEPSQDDTTKGESVEFNTYELEGAIAALANGDWSDTKTFDELDDAKTYLLAKFGTASA